MNKLQLQFKLQLKSIKIVLIFLLLAVFLNLTLSPIPFLDVILGSIVVIAILNFKLFSYFISFGLTRKRYVINNTVFNLIISLLLAVIINFTYFFYSGNKKILYYLGISSIDYSLGNLATGIFLYFMIFAAVISAINFICYLFYERGSLYGLPSLLLILSIPLFFMNHLLNFVVWGTGMISILLGMIIFIVGINFLIYKFLRESELSEG